MVKAEARNVDALSARADADKSDWIFDRRVASKRFACARLFHALILFFGKGVPLLKRGLLRVRNSSRITNSLEDSKPLVFYIVIHSHVSVSFLYTL